MPKPTAVNTTNADAGTDSPATFRADVLDLIGKFNALLSQMTDFVWGLLASADAAAARATLGVLPYSITETAYTNASKDNLYATAVTFTPPRSGRMRVTVWDAAVLGVAGGADGAFVRLVVDGTQQGDAYYFANGESIAACWNSVVTTASSVALQVRATPTGTANLRLRAINFEMVA